MGYLK
jgi:hypothetical protein